MTVLLLLLVVSLSLGAGGLSLFLWSVRAGQYEDLEGAARRILIDVPPASPLSASPLSSAPTSTTAASSSAASPAGPAPKRRG